MAGRGVTHLPNVASLARGLILRLSARGNGAAIAVEEREGGGDARATADAPPVRIGARSMGTAEKQRLATWHVSLLCPSHPLHHACVPRTSSPRELIVPGPSFGEAQSCGSWSRGSSRVKRSLSRARRGRPPHPMRRRRHPRCAAASTERSCRRAALQLSLPPASPPPRSPSPLSPPLSPHPKPPPESPKCTRRHTTRARRRRGGSGCANSRTRRRTRSAQLRRCARRRAR